MHHSRLLPLVFRFVLLLGAITGTLGCQQKSPPGDDEFFKRQNAAHDGDYLATYPLSSPDSCIMRLQAEVPKHLQAWACFSLWYRLPRSSPERSFRLLELYDTHYPHDTVFAFTQLMRGEFMTELHLHDSARVFLADARQRYMALQRPLDASDADYLLARCYSQENNIPKALDTYFGVLRLINSHDTTFSHRHAYLYNDISSVYRSSKDIHKELYWLQKAWKSDHSHLDKAWVYQAKMAQRLSSAYAMIKPDSSLIMAQLAVDIFNKNATSPTPPELQYQLGRAHFKKGNCATALPLQLDAYRRNTDQQDAFSRAQFAQSVGESNFCLGQLDSAEWYIRQALVTPDTGNIVGAHKRLSQIYAQRGDYKAAFTEVTLAGDMNQRLYSAERASSLSEFEARYESAQKQARITELEAKRKIAKQGNLIFALALLIALGLLTVLLLQQRTRHRSLAQEHELLSHKKALAEAREQLKIQELENSQILLKSTRAELDQAAKLLVLKSELIEELETRLSQQTQQADASDSYEKSSFRSAKILTEADWTRFRERFDQQMPGYMAKLKMAHPSLTSAELRLFLLIKLDFDTLEISGVLGISKDSIWRSRHRLSKKLGLSETTDLNAFVQTFQPDSHRQMVPGPSSDE